MAAKFEVEVFNGEGDLILWRKKMGVVLIQQKDAKAIDKSYAAGLSDDKRTDWWNCFEHNYTAFVKQREEGGWHEAAMCERSINIAIIVGNLVEFLLKKYLHKVNQYMEENCHEKCLNSF